MNHARTSHTQIKHNSHVVGDEPALESPESSTIDQKGVRKTVGVSSHVDQGAPARRKIAVFSAAAYRSPRHRCCGFRIEGLGFRAG